MVQLSTKEVKQTGSHYTPKILSDFVAQNIVKLISDKNRHLMILDPAVGDGELLLSIIQELYKNGINDFEIHGYDTNENAINFAIGRIKSKFPDIDLNLICNDFLEYVLDNYTSENSLDLFKSQNVKYNIIITNPPYVRTQVLGAFTSQRLSNQFGLTGRVDLYHAFIQAYSSVLKNGGIAGIIVSNRFMLTRAGATTRKSILQSFDLIKLWDFGDTKLFEAAVLPAVLLVKRNLNKSSLNESEFVSIYSGNNVKPEFETINVIDALNYNGYVRIADGRVFKVNHGILDYGKKLDGVWRISSEETDNWLKIVEKNTDSYFCNLGKVRVGVKTTADKIFIRDNWEDLPLEKQPEIELLKPLLTHHVANRFRVDNQHIRKRILYPHIVVDGKRSVIDLNEFPKTLKYLNEFREKLEGRKYVIESGRKWYEIWVPQDPESWSKSKIVFWDISKKPTFWLDMSGAVVNGDCYWFSLNKGVDEENLWLILAISNSTFIETFYDHKFNNKLYAGRRRFMTQYVEGFPLPVFNSDISREIIRFTKNLYFHPDDNNYEQVYQNLDKLVWNSFGLNFKEVSG